MQKIYDILIPVSAFVSIFLAVFVIFLANPTERTPAALLSGFCIAVCFVCMMLSNEAVKNKGCYNG